MSTVDENPACFFHQSEDDLWVPLRVWLNAVGWASEYSGGSQHPGIIHEFPPGYFERLHYILRQLCHNPNLDNFPLEIDMKPRGDNVLIKVIPPQEKTEGGIYIPESLQKMGLRGTVIAVGPGLYNAALGKNDPMVSKEKQEVLFDKFAGTEILLEGEKHLIMREKFILLHF